MSFLLLLACAGAVPDDGGSDLGATDGGTVDETDLTVSLALPERGYQVVTTPAEVPPYTEVEICSVVRLVPDGDETLAWTGRMESLSSPGTHHMNVFVGQFSFLDAFLGAGASEEALGVPLGQYACSDLPLMEQSFPIFPSQRENQEITMPPGVAAPLPLPLVAIFSHHYVNTGDQPLTVNAALNLETLPAEQVEHVGSLVFDDVPDIEVPSGERRTHARTCVVDRDVDVALVSSHTHQWAACATMNRYDGAGQAVQADPFYVNKLWDQPPILHFEPGSFSLAAGDGVHWACHYENDTDRTLVNDGTASGEMCVFAAVTWPAPWTVAEVEATVLDRDLASLIDLLGDVMGPCDQVRDDVESPWGLGEAGAEAGAVCAALEQTESNTLD